jgi:predicted RNA-binding protein
VSDFETNVFEQGGRVAGALLMEDVIRLVVQDKS